MCRAARAWPSSWPSTLTSATATQMARWDAVPSKPDQPHDDQERSVDPGRETEEVELQALRAARRPDRFELVHPSIVRSKNAAGDPAAPGRTRPKLPVG